MFSKKQYSMLDFGNGRRLERFGPLILDRPCPAALGVSKDTPSLWSKADARFEEETTGKSTSTGPRGLWRPLTEQGQQYFSDNPLAPSKQSWTIQHEEARFSLELKASPFGHLGIFPEQSANWDLIARSAKEFANRNGRPAKVLNLFGYTGGSSLAAASAGAAVTHLDAAKNIVQQAKQNAELSFPENNMRWIVDDAVKYVRRELKRSSQYDVIILDPPTYGHGARGEVWRFSRDFLPLLSDCFALLDRRDFLLLLTCHVTGLSLENLERSVRKTMGNSASGNLTADTMTIQDEKNRSLFAGYKILVQGTRK